MGAILIIKIALFRIDNHKSQIKNWAVRNNYEVIEVEPTYLNWGPFNFAGKNSQVYRATLQNQDGKELTSWFRIGAWRFDQKWETNHVQRGDVTD